MYNYIVNDNNVDTRYLVGQFNDAEWPLPIGICTPMNIVATLYQKAMCINETEATWGIYSDSDCTNPLSVDRVNSSFTQTGLGNYHDFNCDPSFNNSYAHIEMNIASCGATGIDLYGALSTCVVNTGLGDHDSQDIESFKLYCSDNNGEIQYFDTPGSSVGVCTPNTFANIATATDTCGYLLTTSGTPLYGTVE